MESAADHRLNDELSDAVPTRNGSGVVVVVVDQQHLNLTAIASIDRAWGIDQTNAMPSGQAASRDHETYEAGRQRHGDTRWDAGALPGLQLHVDAGPQVGSGVSGVSVFRQRKLRIQSSDEHIDGTGGVRGHDCTAYAENMPDGAPDDSPHQWAEGEEGTQVRFSERLRPSLWAWLIPLSAAVALALAYSVALGPVGALVTFLAVFGIGAYVLLRSVALVQVDDRVFRAGPARLPLQYAGRIRVLDEEEAARVRSSGADAQAYYLLRIGYSKRAIAVEVTDARDPHPYWVVSTRRPDELASAIMEATATHRGRVRNTQE